MSKVAVVKGGSRYENILNALEFLRKEIEKLFENKSRVVIKPNCVAPTKQLACTHVEALRATLDFIRGFYKRKITLAEGSAYSTKDAFENFGYYRLKTYDLEFVDLNNDEFEEIEVFDNKLKPMKVGVAKTMLNADLRISVAPMKTHDTVVVTLGLKNCIVGSLIKQYTIPRVPSRSVRKLLHKVAMRVYRNDKAKLHQGYKAINLSLFKLAKYLYPHLNIIDGFEAMEGNGPVDGEKVKMKLAIASTDFLAADTVAAYLMGFDISQIGYLWYCKEAGLGVGDLKKIEIIGNVDIFKERRKFKPHEKFKEQLDWKVVHNINADSGAY